MKNFKSESNSPRRASWSIHPTQFRDTVQKQIQYTVNESVNAVMFLSNGSIDGRYIMSEPANMVEMSDDNGYYYHIIGQNVLGDLSIVAK